MIISAGSRTLGIAIFHSKRLLFYASRPFAADNGDQQRTLNGIREVVEATHVDSLFLHVYRTPTSECISYEVGSLLKSWNLRLKLVRDPSLSTKTLREMISILSINYPELRFRFTALNKGQRTYMAPMIRAIYLGFKKSQ